jgi:hypothetical protein
MLRRSALKLRLVQRVIHAALRDLPPGIDLQIEFVQHLVLPGYLENTYKVINYMR